MEYLLLWTRVISCPFSSNTKKDALYLMQLPENRSVNKMLAIFLRRDSSKRQRCVGGLKISPYLMSQQRIRLRTIVHLDLHHFWASHSEYAWLQISKLYSSSLSLKCYSVLPLLGSAKLPCSSLNLLTFVRCGSSFVIRALMKYINSESFKKRW